MNIFAERLKTLMDKKGMAEKDLSKSIKISKYRIAKFLHGEVDVPLQDLIKIKKFFGCTLDYLLGLSNAEDKYWI